MVINIDWFEFSTLAVFLKDIENPIDIISFGSSIYLQKCGGGRINGNSHFRYCYEIYLHGELFAIINTCPRASILDSNLSTIKIQNHILYQKGWVARLEFILKALSIAFKGVTRIDIAVDTDNGKFIDDYCKLIAGKYLKLGNAKSTTYHRGDGSVEGFSIGSRSSSKSVRGYIKSEELKSSLKIYIWDTWKQNDLDIDNEIQRLEITLRGKGAKTVKDFDWTRLEDASYTAGVMKSQIQRLFVFVLPTGDKNKSRRPKIQPIDWEYFNAVEVVRLSRTNPKSVVWAVQRWATHEMKRNYAGLDELGNSLFDTAYVRVVEECQKYNLLDWLENRLPLWERDKKYLEMMKAKVRKVRNEKVYMRSRTFNVQHPI